MANHLSYDVLSRLVERRSSALEEARAQRHLANCGRCRSEKEWLERIRGLPGRSGRVERAWADPSEAPPQGQDEQVPPRPGRGGCRHDEPQASTISTYWRVAKTGF